MSTCCVILCPLVMSLLSHCVHLMCHFVHLQCRLIVSTCWLAALPCDLTACAPACCSQVFPHGRPEAAPEHEAPAEASLPLRPMSPVLLQAVSPRPPPRPLQTPGGKEEGQSNRPQVRRSEQCRGRCTM